MLKVQAVLPGSRQGPGNAAKASPARLLEDSDGVVRLYFCDEVLATAHGKVSQEFCQHAEADWFQWYLEELRWERVQALKLLQGASLQQLVGPRYVIVRCVSSPAYAAIPRLERVELAELVETRKSLSRQGFYELIHKAHSTLPPRP